MPTPPEITTARSNFRVSREALIDAMYDAATAKAAYEDAKRTLSGAQLAQFQIAADQAASALATARTNDKTTRQGVRTALTNYLTGVTLDAELAKLDATSALTLFPVRIETRFG